MKFRIGITNPIPINSKIVATRVRKNKKIIFLFSEDINILEIFFKNITMMECQISYFEGFFYFQL